MTLRRTDTGRENRYHQSMIPSLLRGCLIRGLVLIGAVTVVQPVSAHDGSAHAGTPHWAFLSLVLVGGLFVAVSGLLSRNIRGDYPQRVLSGVLFGLAVVLFGLIAIVQIQVEPVGTTPTVHEWYPVLASGVAALLVTGSALFGLWKWPTRPQFTALGVVLGLWVGYPALSRTTGITIR